jgi:MYXO-CTERM domain-containing protein
MIPVKMLSQFRSRVPLLLAIWAACAVWGRAGTATDIRNLYYTGVDNNGTTLDDGETDSHWTVTYARVNGSGSTSSSYTGSAYVVSGDYIDGAWVANSSTSRWITAPGAKTSSSGGSTNAGGDYLPGNGTSGTNAGYYVYRLAFTIVGTGRGNVSNDVSISLTIAADDQYTVYVNPASAPTVNNSGTISAGGTSASASGTSAWDNTTSITLRNYGSGSSNNADFVIGTNYLYIVVANTNSVTGSSSSNALNPSGLLVYQIGSAMTIDGQPVPEVGAFLPLVGAVGLFVWRRRRRPRAASHSRN